MWISDMDLRRLSDLGHMIRERRVGPKHCPQISQSKEGVT